MLWEETVLGFSLAKRSNSFTPLSWRWRGEVAAVTGKDTHRSAKLDLERNVPQFGAHGES